MTPRDRDAEGRPRNARPRDALGRPLPHGADGVPRTPDDLQLDGSATVARARELLDAGLPFHAHEVLEARWKTGPAAERPLWKGLAQLAVGLTHARRGNARGAAALAERGRTAVAPYAGDATAASYGLDIPAILACDVAGTRPRRIDPT